MPWTPWRSTSSATRNASTIVVWRSSTAEQAVVGDDDQRVDLLGQRVHAALGLLAAPRALEAERLGHDRDRQRAHFARDARHDRRGAGARARRRRRRR